MKVVENKEQVQQNTNGNVEEAKRKQARRKSVDVALCSKCKRKHNKQIKQTCVESKQ